MKKIFVLVLFVILVFSCKEDEDYKTVYSVWGITRLSDADDLGYRIEVGDSLVFIPTITLINYVPQDSDRVNLNFQLADGVEFENNPSPMDIELLDIIYASIDDLVVASDTTISDTLARDPIAVFDNYIRQDGNLLDVFFYIPYSGFKYHTVDLVYFPDSLATEPKGVYLELRHNANHDYAAKSSCFLHCFDMESIEPFRDVQDSVPYTLVINAGAYQGAKSKIEGYYYNPSLTR